MSAHTPGPWELDTNAEQVSGADGSVVHAWWGNADDAEIAIADARLIAAAPTMLAALKEIVIQHDHHVATFEGCSMANDMGHIARAAIAAAEEGA